MTAIQQRNALITDNIYLAEWIFKKLRAPMKLWLYEYDDVLQIIRVALVKAADAFDPAKGRYSTLAFGIARNDLFKLRGTATCIRVPMYVFYDDGALADSPRVQRARSVTQIGMDAHRIGLDARRASTTSAVQPDDSIDRRDTARTVRKLIRRLKRCLSKREWYVFSRHYLGGQTLPQIGSALKLTKQRIHQLYKVSMAKVRKLVAEKMQGLRELLED